MRKQIGQLGEDKAVQFLKVKGYSILHRNYRTRFGELDIVCQDQHSLVFIEVKTRTSIKFGYPEEAITYQKIKHVKKAAAIYINNEQKRFSEVRFDVVTVLKSNSKWIINHIENAF
ncbi:MAG: YraN family protein [Syntrophomonadaceae bacterium]|jgi:putative endonuclease